MKINGLEENKPFSGDIKLQILEEGNNFFEFKNQKGKFEGTLWLNKAELLKLQEEISYLLEDEE
jgi:hypothetical protein